jgi:hypothetical protein
MPGRVDDLRPRLCVELAGLIALSQLDYSEPGREKKLASPPASGQSEKAFDDPRHGSAIPLARQLNPATLRLSESTGSRSPVDERAEHGAEDRMAGELLGSHPRIASQGRPRAVEPIWMDPVDDRHRGPRERVLDLCCDDAGPHSLQPEPFECGSEDGAVRDVESHAHHGPGAPPGDEPAEQPGVGVTSPGKLPQYRLARRPRRGRSSACNRAPHLLVLALHVDVAGSERGRLPGRRVECMAPHAARVVRQQVNRDRGLG